MANTSANPVSTPRMTADDVGDYYVDEHGGVWKLIGFCEHPTATLEKLRDPGAVLSLMPERRGGAVGAPIFNGFRKLVPES